MPYRKNPTTNQIIKLDVFGEEFSNWLIPTDAELLQEAITAKLAELEAFHDSNAARIFYVKTAKNTFVFSTLDKYRNLLSEQISICDSSVKSGFPMNQVGYTHKQTHPTNASYYWNCHI